MAELREIFPGVWEYEGKILTKNRVPGKKVYGEQLIKIGGVEYRVWNPYRSKLAAAIKNGLRTWAFEPGVNVLYLGIAEGTTASHISDILGDDSAIIGVDIAPRVMPKIIAVAEERGNILPVLADASKPEEYPEEVIEFIDRVGGVDVVYQDVAAPNQAEILWKNVDRFLKRGGHAYIAIKSRSVDVTRDPREVFREFREFFTSKGLEVVEEVSIEPYEKDHEMMVLRKR
ncbi:TPA: fibrillarin-like rRNA/tRNA 2'-O-methyltransferase [Candidatus Micrarchaeota archaeon]|nr:fibrillarin-like rRNA/tRNA 2'-O-methyltransferase [Candidatus Micrarchaeota archaeon]